MRIVVLGLLVFAALASPATASTPTVDGTDYQQGGAGTGTEPTTAGETATSATDTAMASDGTFAGFTLGAALLAVVVAGSYRYLRR